MQPFLTHLKTEHSKSWGGAVGAIWMVGNLGGGAVLAAGDCGGVLGKGQLSGPRKRQLIPLLLSVLKVFQPFCAQSLRSEQSGHQSGQQMLYPLPNTPAWLRVPAWALDSAHAVAAVAAVTTTSRRSLNQIELSAEASLDK